MSAIKRPPDGKPRERRLRDGELSKLLNGCTGGRTKLLAPAIELAIETAMRRGELLSVHWRDVDLKRKTLHIRETKNGRSRTIPLTPRAVDLLKGLAGETGAVIPWSANALRLAWERLRVRAGINDLHFHDLRHEAISRFFELGLTVPEVASISGHRDMRMLMRYAHANAEIVAARIMRG